MIITEQIADIIRTVPGVQAATDNPPGQIAQDPIAIVYCATWAISADTASNGRGNIQYGGDATIRADIHVGRADIENAMRILEAFAESVPVALYRAFDPANDAVRIAFKTAPRVSQSIVQGNYNGIETIVRRFDITGRVLGEANR